MRYIRVDGVVDGRPSEHDGRFLVEFDVDRKVEPRMDNGVIIETFPEDLQVREYPDAH